MVLEFKEIYLLTEDLYDYCKMYYINMLQHMLLIKKVLMDRQRTLSMYTLQEIQTIQAHHTIIQVWLIQIMYRFTKSGSFTTIGHAMSFNPPSNPSQGDTSSVNLGIVSDSQGNSGTLSYRAIYLPVGTSTTNFDWYIESFTLAGFSSGIDGTYDLPLTDVTGTDRAPFWFFSLNGQAISPNTIKDIH